MAARILTKAPRCDHISEVLVRLHWLKSLRSVQISILKPKITPEVLRIDQYYEKIWGMLATKSFFSVRFGVTVLPSLLSYR